jgi:hypothetical protein
LIFLFLLALIVHWLSSSSSSRRIEGAQTKTPYSTNPTYTYVASFSANSAPSMKFGLGDLDTELERTCDFLKYDNSLLDPSYNSETGTEYSVAESELKLHGLYKNAVSQDDPESAMDASFGKMFDSRVIQDWTNEKLVSTWHEMESVKVDNAIFTLTDNFVIHSDKPPGCVAMNSDSSGTTFGGYFLQAIIYNKFDKAELLKLKKAYYFVIKPRFLANKVAELYWQNWQTLMNADGKSHDSILYVLNVMSSLVASATLPVDLSGTGVKNILTTKEKPSPFTMDSLRLYQTSSVAYELFRFMKRFSAELPAGKSPIKTTVPIFVDGFQKYLDTLNKISVASIMAFVLKNPPNPKDCPNDLLK